MTAIKKPIKESSIEDHIEYIIRVELNKIIPKQIYNKKTNEVISNIRRRVREYIHEYDNVKVKKIDPMQMQKGIKNAARMLGYFDESWIYRNGLFRLMKAKGILFRRYNSREWYFFPLLIMKFRRKLAQMENEAYVLQPKKRRRKYNPWNPKFKEKFAKERDDYIKRYKERILNGKEKL